MAERVADGHVDEALGPELRDRLDADRRALADLGVHLAHEEIAHAGGFRGAGAPLDAGVHVLRVLAEDDDVESLGVLDGRPHAPEVAHGADARVQVELAAERHVERADPAADGRGERTLDADAVLAQAVERFRRQPLPRAGERLLAGQDLHPLYGARAAGGFRDGGVEHASRGAPDVRSDPVTLDERDDGTIGNHEAVGAPLDARTHTRTWRRAGGNARAMVSSGPSGIRRGVASIVMYTSDVLRVNMRPVRATGSQKS